MNKSIMSNWKLFTIMPVLVSDLSISRFSHGLIKILEAIVYNCFEK